MKNSTQLSVSAEFKKQAQIEIARRSFWWFCKVMAPAFYKDERAHLKELCTTLDDFYNNKLPYKNLAIQMPPRHGKSRTLTNFSAWILGKNKKNRIITGSFNDDLAQDFSRHTRDIIQEEATLPEEIVYSDIFPESAVKHGDASYKKWALEGEFFNYKGTGVGGSITGRGANWLIIDDPIKDAETAYNPAALEKIWLWYTGTILSRQETGAKKIICMTPWASGDLLSKVIQLEPEKWKVITMPAYDGMSMLCEDLLTYEEYQDYENIMDENIFSANYKMERIDIKGKLYQNIKTYPVMPGDTEKRFFYTDTADEGNDYLCSIAAEKKGQFLFVTDVIYTKEPQEETEKQQAEFVIRNKLIDGYIESNNGGRGFARNVKRILKENYYRESIEWFHQSKNKKARILTNASTVQNYVFFPDDWAIKWAEFYNAINRYQKEGKNKHDDGPDALTGLVEYGLDNNKIIIPDESAALLAKRRRVL